MPVTRSKQGSMAEDRSATASGSAATSAATTEATERTTSTECTVTSKTDTTATTAQGHDATLRPERRARSRRSDSRRQKLQLLKQEEKVAALKLEEIRASLALAQAKLKRQRAADEEEEEHEGSSSSGEDEDRSSRVQEWLESQGQDPVEKKKPEEKTRARGQVANEEPMGALEEAPPTRHPHGVDVDSLAAALTQAVRMTRDAPKYLQELPVFNGQCSGWLAFRAAYYETEGLFTKVENVSRLRRSVKGVALEAVSSLLISQPDPGAIMEALERRFGRPDALAMSEMNKMKSLGRLTDNPRDMCVFANKVANIVATIEALKKVHYLHNPELVMITVEKLTPIVRNKWYDYAAKTKEDVPDMKRLAAFLNEEADKCSLYAQPEDVSACSVQDKPRKRYERTYNTNVKEVCPSCKQEHQLLDCKKFKDADVGQRWEIAKRSRVCFRCLKGMHRRGDCRARNCGQDNCEMSHHRLLHRKRTAPPPPASPPPASPPPTTPPPSTPKPPLPPDAATVSSTNEIVNNADNRRTRQAYLKIAPVTLTGTNGTRVDTFALMDDGSTVTLVEDGVTEILGLDGPRCPMWVQGFNQTAKHEESKKIDITIRGRYTQQDYVMKNVRTVQRLSLGKQNVAPRDIEDCEHLRDIEEQITYEDIRPTVLIGQDNWELLVATETRAGKRDQLVASNTRLGWVLHGCRTSRCDTIGFCGTAVAVAEPTVEKTMEDKVKEFFDLESLGVAPKRPKNDPEEQAVRMLEENSRRTPDGRFETTLLWKDKQLVIPNNYENSFKRLKDLEKKLDRDPDLKVKYEERVENLLTAGYAVPATEPATPGRTWYLPHFPVSSPSKQKIRLVHDAAARSQGWSLNDMLLPGPDLLQSLPGVIMRFRQHPFAVSADIKEMFMQIKIKPEDRDALRFLWRGDQRGDTKPDEYQMTSVIFGATSSPCTALYIKNRNAEDFKGEYPQAVQQIKKNHYMDDFITSFPNCEEAIKVSKEVDYVHRQAGFILRGWTSNHERISQEFNETTDAATVNIGGNDADQKTLGLLWKVKDDDIGFRINEDKTPPAVQREERPPTKREALSVIMSLFDPLGLVSPLTTPAKRLLQETWRYGTGWDEPIPKELQPRWTAWLRNLRSLKSLRIPRCYNIGQAVMERELHTFVDASEEAYAAAVYIRMVRTDGTVHVSLAAGKSRVAPLKPISIPRLELQAALLGARLAQTTAEEHDFSFNRRVYWSDSRTVLAWIRAEPRSFKTFVAHRLAEIEETTKVNEWRWLPTKENVADDATRDTPSNFDSQHRWFHGPEFLRRPEEEWPTEQRTTAEKTGEERCHVASERKAHGHLPSLERIRKWQVLIRATGRVLQFLDLCRTKKHTTAAARRRRTKANKEEDPAWTKTKAAKTDKPAAAEKRTATQFRRLDAIYLQQAEKLWIQATQEDSYSNEMKRISDGGTPSSKDRLASLSVYISGDGLLRLRGRITETQGITSDTANPAVLDGQHEYTKKYIQHVHEKMLHGGTELVVNEIRQRFWITRIRPTVKSVIRSCLKCQIRKAKPMCPATGDLPPARLAHSTRPFSCTGVDYFGPIEVTVGRHREKRWVALFTCLTMRAVHLELVPSLSADSAISALRRFVARRGVPTELWSDNATCFKAANKELKEALTAMGNEASASHVNWRFIPPASPFMGGAWERLVRSVKEALRTTLKEKHPSDETLLTLLIEAENIINSRPLTHVAVTPDVPEALTPNHILLGPNCHVPAPGVFNQDDDSARQLWRRAQLLADEFWRRWMREYLPQLQHRREPHSTGITPKIGDIVIVCDSNLPRNVWPRGKVTKIYPGKDGEVRVVDITTSHGHILRRPCKKIVVLPL